MKTFLKTISFPYIILVLYFVGIGLLSGSIVHYSLDPSRYLTIGIVGAGLFVIGAILNEIIVLRHNIFTEGIWATIRFILSSLTFSIGIGMMSGGIQHFDDIAQYATILIPLGFAVSLISFIVKNKIKLNMQHTLILILKIVIIAVPLNLGLGVLASHITENPSETHAD